MSSEILVDILKVLEAGVPLDHGNRTDARITQIEEAVKAILVYVMGPQPGLGPEAQGLQGPQTGPDA